MRSEDIKRIVVIEKDPIFRESVSKQLKKMKQVAVEIYSSAEECLNKMKKDPELILLDFSLRSKKEGAMNGHDALNQFRKKKASQKIIFISGRIDMELLEEYKQYRAIDYIRKSSFVSNQMIEKVKNQLFAA